MTWQADERGNATGFTSDADNPTNAVGGWFILGLRNADAAGLNPTNSVGGLEFEHSKLCAQELRQEFHVYSSRDAREHELRQEFHVPVTGSYISLLTE